MGICETPGCNEAGMMNGKYRHCQPHLTTIVRKAADKAERIFLGKGWK